MFGAEKKICIQLVENLLYFEKLRYTLFISLLVLFTISADEMETTVCYATSVKVFSLDT